MFQAFGEESSTLFLTFYLILGVCVFLLLILLISIILITLSKGTQALVTNNSKNEKDSSCYAVEKDLEHCNNGIKIVEQSEQIQNGLLMKGQQMIIVLCELFNKFAQFPVSLYIHLVEFTVEINNDFIRIE